MFSVVRNTLNASCHHYRTPLSQMCRNSLDSGIKHYFNHSNCLPQIVRNYSALIKSHNDRRWIKIFKNIWPPERTSGIRSFRQKTSRKSVPEDKSDSISQLPKPEYDTVSWNTLVRPFLFTICFTGASFSCAAIWQYENMRNIAKLKAEYGKSAAEEMFRTWSGNMPKAGKFREELNKFWNQLSEADKVFAPILAINVLVFALWRVPALQPMMYKYFTGSPHLTNKGLPMLLSAFSHTSLVHLGCNMFVLHSFIGPMVATLGKEQFMGLYMSSSVITSFFSHMYKVKAGRIGASLGASGAICTILGIFATLSPESRLQIIFLPFFSFSASIGIKCLMAMDTAGLIAGWQIFDHAAHLSGVLYGIWWCHQGHDLIWNKRENVMELWRDVRK